MMVLIIEGKNFHLCSGGGRGESPQIAILNLKTSSPKFSLGFFMVKHSELLL